MYGILDSTVPEFIKESLKLREKSSLNLYDGTEPASDLGLSVRKLVSFTFFFYLEYIPIKAEQPHGITRKRTKKKLKYTGNLF